MNEVPTLYDAAFTVLASIEVLKVIVLLNVCVFDQDNCAEVLVVAAAQ
jgi:hypothetical protein